jgi:hypothetical protein
MKTEYRFGRRRAGGSRAGPEHGDRTLGRCTVRRPAWAIGPLWPLGQAGRAGPWGE